MTTILKASPRRFVSTPAIERVASRALRYLQSGYSVHLRGPAGTGKTTLALHLADLLARPIMLVFGDDEFKTSDLIGNQSGYTRKKVVDNFIHSVVKVEDELRQNWVDSRLTLACREGFTLVYDEFNRSRPEVNNVLLSALEEKLLVLPPSNDRPEYVRVNPQFRAIFTSNPEEYVGVHATQDALLDRLITMHIPEHDELTQQEIVTQKTEIDRESARIVVQVVRSFRQKTQTEKTSGLRSCLMLAKVCHEHEIVATPENAEFREICQDVLLSRSGLSLTEATQLLWEVFNEQILASVGATKTVGFAPAQRIDEAPTGFPELVENEAIALYATAAEPDSVEEILAEAIAQASVEVAETPDAEVASAEADTTETTAAELETTVVEPIEADITETAAVELETADAELEIVGVEIEDEFTDVEFAEAAVIDSTEADLSEDTAKTATAEIETADSELEVADSELEIVGIEIEDTFAEVDFAEANIATTDMMAAVDEIEPESGLLALVQPEMLASEENTVAKAIAQSSTNAQAYVNLADDLEADEPQSPELPSLPHSNEVYQYLQQNPNARPSEVEAALGISRVHTVNAIQALTQKGLVSRHNGSGKPSRTRRGK